MSTVAIIGIQGIFVFIYSQTSDIPHIYSFYLSTMFYAFTSWVALMALVLVMFWVPGVTYQQFAQVVVAYLFHSMAMGILVLYMAIECGSSSSVRCAYWFPVSRTRGIETWICVVLFMMHLLGALKFAAYKRYFSKYIIPFFCWGGAVMMTSEINTFLFMNAQVVHSGCNTKPILVQDQQLSRRIAPWDGSGNSLMPLFLNFVPPLGIIGLAVYKKGELNLENLTERELPWKERYVFLASILLGIFNVFYTVFLASGMRNWVTEMWACMVFVASIWPTMNFAPKWMVPKRIRKYFRTPVEDNDVSISSTGSVLQTPQPGSWYPLKTTASARYRTQQDRYTGYRKEN